MSDIKDLTDKIIKFRDERNWKQFHKPKDLAISLALESAEVLEHFQWKSEKEVEDYVKSHKDEIGEEIADVFIYLMYISYGLDIDVKEAVEKKIIKNGKKYPVEKAKDTAKKYNQL